MNPEFAIGVFLSIVGPMIAQRLPPPPPPQMYVQRNECAVWSPYGFCKLYRGGPSYYIPNRPLPQLPPPPPPYYRPGPPLPPPQAMAPAPLPRQRPAAPPIDVTPPPAASTPDVGDAIDAIPDASPNNARITRPEVEAAIADYCNRSPEAPLCKKYNNKETVK